MTSGAAVVRGAKLASQASCDRLEIGDETRAEKIGNAEIYLPGVTIEPCRRAGQPVGQQEELRRAWVEAAPVVEAEQSEPGLPPLRESPYSPRLGRQPASRRFEQHGVGRLAE